MVNETPQKINLSKEEATYLIRKAFRTTIFIYGGIGLLILIFILKR